MENIFYADRSRGREAVFTHCATKAKGIPRLDARASATGQGAGLVMGTILFGIYC